MTFYYIPLASLMLLLLGNFLCGISPFLLLSKFFKNDHDICRRNKALTLLIYFGGGVFMSICFLSLQPDAVKEYEKHFHHCSNTRRLNVTIPGFSSENESHEEGFSIPDFIILCSFLTLFGIEELAQLILSSIEKNSLEKSKKVQFCSCAKRHTECSRAFKAVDPAEQTLFGLEQHLLESNKDAGQQEYSIIPRPSETAIETERELLQSSIISQAVPNYGAVTDIVQLNANSPIIIPTIILDDEGKVTVSPSSSNQVDYKSSITFLLLAVVLSFYNICQGVSLGFQRDSFIWSILIQITQQFIVSFVAGIVVSQDPETLPVMCFIGLLSLMGPFGISLTMIFDDRLIKISHLAKSIINSTLCGSLLYITFFNLLRGNALHNTPSFGKFISFTCGATAVAGLRYILVLL